MIISYVIGFISSVLTSFSSLVISLEMHIKEVKIFVLNVNGVSSLMPFLSG